jgi:hypothetical protein
MSLFFTIIWAIFGVILFEKFDSDNIKNPDKRLLAIFLGGPIVWTYKLSKLAETKNLFDKVRNWLHKE